MNLLFIDYETRSELDLRVVGLDRYIRHPSTKVLMMSYAFDDGPIERWEPHTGPMPAKLCAALHDPNVTKLAWNWPFEHGISFHVLGIEIPHEHAVDIMILARHLSLPGKLELAGPAIGLLYDELKKSEGKRLIELFSKPFRLGGKATLFGTTEPEFHGPHDRPKEWAQFGEYCDADVISERAIYNIVSQIKFPEKERRAWLLDQKINERGIPTNRLFVQKALALSLASKKRLMDKLKEITGLKNPNSRPQFLPWAQQRGFPFLSIGKEFVRAALESDSGIDALLRTALKLRQQAVKTSYTKFETLLNLLSEDDRLRHQFAFMGAARTGRWAGKDAQVQNMARPVKAVEEHYQEALDLIENCPLPVTDEYVDMVEAKCKSWDKDLSVMGMSISCIRSVFQASKGKKLVVCDLSSIENVVLGWLAQCEAIARVFREGRDAYLDFASKMYALAYESIIKIVDGKHKPKDKDAAEKRQVAKPAVLGAGYGLGPGVIKHPDGTYEVIYKKDDYGNEVMTGLMGYAANMGVKLTPEQAYLAWETFQKAYPEVTDKKDGLWAKWERAAIKVLQTGTAVRVGFVIFQRRARKDGTFILRLQLPSGRGLHYLNARIETEIAVSKRTGKEYERKKVMYDGIGHGVGKIGKGGKWGKVYTYGGKFVENGDQGLSRDILVEGLFLADDAGAAIVMHTHDEIVCEEDDDPFAFGLAELKTIMCTTPEWAPGLIIGAEGFEGQVYKK